MLTVTTVTGCNLGSNNSTARHKLKNICTHKDTVTKRSFTPTLAMVCVSQRQFI